MEAIGSAILGQIKALVGRTYLAVGLLPAAVILIGWRGYKQGPDTLQSDLINLLSGKALPAMLLEILALALVLVALRGPALRFLQDVPGSLLGPLRSALVKKQIKVRSGLMETLADAEWSLTLLHWPIAKFEEVKYLPAGRKHPVITVAIQSSRQAREILSRPGGSSTKEEMERVVRGLSDLYVCDFHGDRNQIAEEISKWTSLLASDAPHRHLKAINESTMRSWVAAYRRTRAFPEERWIRPTRLGNRLAVLNDYAALRYGIDTSTIWTRLWRILSKDEQTDVSLGQLQVETMVNLSLAFALLAAMILGDGLLLGLAHLRILGTWTWPAWLSLGIGTMPILAAIACYRGSVFAFDVLSEKIVAIIDLNRLRLIKELGFEAPTTFLEERDLLSSLGRFFNQAEPLPDTLRVRNP